MRLRDQVIGALNVFSNSAVAPGSDLIGTTVGIFFANGTVTGAADGAYNVDLDGVTSDMSIAKEETFGPVAPIMTFGDLDEALAVANETDYGLTAAVFTRSLHDAWHAAEELRHGTVHINETTNYWDQLAPFGGAKKSGTGRELAGWIIDALTETKQITFDLAD